MIDFLLENTDIDLLEITESEIVQERWSDAVISKEKLKDDEYVKRLIKNIKNDANPLTLKEYLFYMGSIIAVFSYTFSPLLVALTSLIVARLLVGGFDSKKIEEKSKDRILKSIDDVIKKAESANPKDAEQKKKLKEEIEKLKKNRELVEKKLK